MTPILRVAVLVSLLLPVIARAAQPLDTALTTLRTFKVDDDRAPLVVIEAAVAQAVDDAARQALADRLLAVVIDSSASLDGRRLLLFQVRSLASAPHVPALIALLKDANLSVEARGVLETIADPKASEALRDAAASLQGAELAGVLGSLGVRKDAASVPLLAGHLKSSDIAIANAAAWSLGRIGDAAATKALLGADLQSRTVAEALLMSARSSGDKEAFTKLSKPPAPNDLRIIALGQILADGQSVEPIVAAAASDDAVQRAAAMEALRRANNPAWTAKVALESKSAVQTVRLLGMLIAKPDPSARAAFEKYLNDADAAVRTLAIRGLGLTGDHTSIAPLLAVTGKDDALIVAALSQLKGDKVDGALAEQLASSNPPQSATIIRALVERNVRSSVPAMVKLTSAADATTRAEAIRALGELGDAAVCPTLIGLLANDQNEPAARNALVALCRRNNKDVTPIVTAYDSAQPATKASLLKVISAVGGSSALALVRRELAAAEVSTQTEALRCLANWADESALADLVAVSASSNVVVQKTLALRAIARLIPMATSIDNARKVQILASSLKLAGDAQTRTALISALGTVPTAASLELLSANLADKEQCGPSSAAILTIAKKPGKLPAAALRTALNEIVKAKPSDPAVQQAKQELKKLDKPTPPAAPPTALKWVEDANSLALVSGEQVVWKFLHDPADGKPCFDPVAPVGKPSIAWKSPSDHIWHYGLWFSWKLINGVNYWEENAKTHKAAGLTNWKDVVKKTNPDGSATISLALEYALPNTAPVLTEKRTITITAPAADGSYSMDWTQEFKVGDKDIVLDRTPLPGEKDGKAFGGYAGLSLRMKKLTNIQAITTEGPVQFNKEDRFRGPALACEYSGTVDGQQVGVAMIDHPSNLNAPSPWYVIRGGMCYFNAAVLLKGPVNMKAGETFTLKYRVIVHPGAMEVEQLKKAAEAFAK